MRPTFGLAGIADTHAEVADASGKNDAFVPWARRAGLLGVAGLRAVAIHSPILAKKLWPAVGIIAAGGSDLAGHRYAPVHVAVIARSTEGVVGTRSPILTVERAESAVPNGEAGEAVTTRITGPTRRADLARVMLAHDDTFLGATK